MTTYSYINIFWDALRAQLDGWVVIGHWHIHHGFTWLDFLAYKAGR